ncbi:MAG: hypothetical protein ACREO9_05000, partial [Lysobacterales bacterium]
AMHRDLARNPRRLNSRISRPVHTIVSTSSRTDVNLSATAADDLEQQQYDLSNLQLELNTLSSASGKGETVTVNAPAAATPR